MFSSSEFRSTRFLFASRSLSSRKFLQIEGPTKCLYFIFRSGKANRRLRCIHASTACTSTSVSALKEGCTKKKGISTQLIIRESFYSSRICKIFMRLGVQGFSSVAKYKFKIKVGKFKTTLSKFEKRLLASTFMRIEQHLHPFFFRLGCAVSRAVELRARNKDSDFLGSSSARRARVTIIRTIDFVGE